jgi:putative glutamine amidotransferase
MVRRCRRPVIGITLDAEPPGGYSRYPWYALRGNYAQSIAVAGGVPLAVPHFPELAPAFADCIDGLVITGGAFDIDPTLYGAQDRHPSVKLKPGRTDAEIALLREALARDMPVLGICGGQQLLAALLGGRLIQHIAQGVAAPIAHEQPNPRHEAGHWVAITPGTRLYQIVGSGTMRVNSSHHQAVADPGTAVVNARAPDGVIEGIEVSDRRFCLGVQWHPEFNIDPGDARLFAALIAACR